MPPFRRLFASTDTLAGLLEDPDLSIRQVQACIDSRAAASQCRVFPELGSLFPASTERRRVPKHVLPSSGVRFWPSRSACQREDFHSQAANADVDRRIFSRNNNPFGCTAAV